MGLLVGEIGGNAIIKVCRYTQSKQCCMKMESTRLCTSGPQLSVLYSSSLVDWRSSVAVSRAW